jgi:predicted DNA binding CopG/RHH family protein
MKKKFDPFKNLVLDEYEQEIEDNLPDFLDLTPLPKKELNRLSRMAKDTLLDLKKDKNMNIRVSKITIAKLKKKAAKLGLGYQTMVGSILHQYANS